MKYIEKDKAYKIVLHYGSYAASAKIANLDGIEIVLCKECKYSQTCGFISERPYSERANWFCADGERKEAEHEV